jgi:hypothetical protein
VSIAVRVIHVALLYVDDVVYGDDQAQICSYIGGAVTLSGVQGLQELSAKDLPLITLSRNVFSKACKTASSVGNPRFCSFVRMQ